MIENVAKIGFKKRCVRTTAIDHRRSIISIFQCYCRSIEQGESKRMKCHWLMHRNLSRSRKVFNGRPGIEPASHNSYFEHIVNAISEIIGNVQMMTWSDRQHLCSFINRWQILIWIASTSWLYSNDFSSCVHFLFAPRMWYDHRTREGKIKNKDRCLMIIILFTASFCE
jgi:hypothetical protein